MQLSFKHLMNQFLVMVILFGSMPMGMTAISHNKIDAQDSDVTNAHPIQIPHHDDLVLVIEMSDKMDDHCLQNVMNCDDCDSCAHCANLVTPLCRLHAVLHRPLFNQSIVCHDDVDLTPKFRPPRHT